MTDIKIRAATIATAVKTAGGGRITKEAADATVRGLAPLLANKQLTVDEMLECSSLFTNLSALNQELERAGVIKSTHEASALMREVGAQLAVLNKK